jgi:hypothetical protein
MTTRKEIIIDLVNNFKDEIKEFDEKNEIEKFLPIDTDIADLIFLMINIFSGDVDSTLNELFLIYNIETKDNEKVKEIIKRFIDDFKKLP